MQLPKRCDFIYNSDDGQNPRKQFYSKSLLSVILYICSTIRFVTTYLYFQLMKIKVREVHKVADKAFGM
jgi:hypothetical protein